MKTSTRIKMILFSLLVCLRAWSQNEPVLTLTTALNSKDASQLVFEPDGELEISIWNEASLQLTIEINNTELRREQIKALTPLALFKSETVLEGKCLLLNMPGLKRKTIINGKEIVWNIRYILKIPRSIQVVRKSTGLEIQ